MVHRRTSAAQGLDPRNPHQPEPVLRTVRPDRHGPREIFTKPGSEDYHGELQFHYGNDIFNSRNPFTPDKPPP
jgi:hypothetical protein